MILVLNYQVVRVKNYRLQDTKAMGIDVPVLAWGIGIDRMALMALGLNDLRELFCEDVERVRLRKAKF